MKWFRRLDSTVNITKTRFGCLTLILPNVIYCYFPKTHLGFSRHMSLADNLGIKAPSHSLKSRSSDRCPVLHFLSETSSVAATSCRSPIVRTPTPTWTAAGWKARVSSAMPVTMSSQRFDMVMDCL